MLGVFQIDEGAGRLDHLDVAIADDDDFVAFRINGSPGLHALPVQKSTARFP